MNHTLDYYENNAEQFVAETSSINFSNTQNRFLYKLKEEATILDFGCGSGRDTKYFLEHGFQVEAIDGSIELCKTASKMTGIQVKHMLFQELEEYEKYDGIWACSSILHVPKKELPSILFKMKKALKANGVIYASFKYGTFEGEKKERYFTDMTESAFAELLKEVQGLRVEEQWITSDVRPGRGEEQWLNLILRKD